MKTAKSILGWLLYVTIMPPEELKTLSASELFLLGSWRFLLLMGALLILVLIV